MLCWWWPSLSPDTSPISPCHYSDPLLSGNKVRVMATLYILELRSRACEVFSIGSTNKWKFGFQVLLFPKCLPLWNRKIMQLFWSPNENLNIWKDIESYKMLKKMLINIVDNNSWICYKTKQTINARIWSLPISSQTEGYSSY